MSATDSLRQQISTHFGDEVGGNLAEECISLCQMYNLTADELFFKWEALASTLGSRVLNAETIDILRSNIHRKTTKPETKSNLNMNIVTSKRLKGPPKLGGSIYSTPKKPLAGPINGASTGDSSRAGVAGPSKVQFVGYNMDGDSRSTRRYRYMYEKILDRSAALDDRIDDIAELVQKHYDIVELDSDLKYEPWLAFLRRVGREKPAVILIVGPFIDSSHPYIKNGVEAQPDAMANLCRHVLQQRSFYPIFPVPLDAAHEVNLDITHSDGLSINLDTADDFAPDVLILPSKLKQFSKTVDHTVVVNPSFLTKGTFAHLTYAGSESGGTIKDGLRVDVVKLE
ncbi:hypothetical protein EW026_g4274 [Hermanssonia centrifuga]|uniref:DNA polymerase alpha subunit B N-terminal domain-containing protein n=1 Tax=Hermanssonia centrifuga TaxID=98765 RepID=A0A4S4KHK5_9APHY|nr:hypothetical protein EW026_g4274 [Hermanssonia centrifuga]